MQKVYFDHNATTAIDKKVLSVMMPFLETQQGNPTSHIASVDMRELRLKKRVNKWH